MKKILLLVTVFTAMFALSACNTSTDDPDPDPDPTDLIELTLEELAEYDGLDGQPAYIAVDGKIYDVTDDPNWQGGSHNGFYAGQDLTSEIGSASPHGTSVLAGVPHIGTLVDSTTEEPVDEMVYLTITELAMYDGMGGNDAYIAYEGMIYDVTDVAAWSGGSHNGVNAGQDITKEIMSAPHGTSPVEGLTAIGELVIDNSGEGPYDPYLYLSSLELLMYDGTNGNPAYIAYSGVLYDVTDHSAWTSGSHQGADAGTDVTAAFDAGPHGLSILSGLVIVGELLDGTSGTTNTYNDYCEYEECNSNGGSMTETIYLTITELAMYDGMGANDAYIAYEGMIYDVTDVAAWSGGNHNGVSAGQDITAEITNAPHGTSPVEGLTAIGELVVDSSGDGPYDPYLYLTTTELAMYNGQGGNDAYVAYEGVLYDVTGVAAWSNGTHNGVTAGTDVTTVINNAPHGTTVLAGLVIVGELLD